jgi:NADPH-dependent F420 reductase
MISILGTGDMARAIAIRLLAAGMDVTILGTQAKKADELAAELRGEATGNATVTTGTLGDPISNDIVVLAVPYDAARRLLEQYGSQLGGRIVIDITNPVNATFDDLVTSPGSSGAEEFARLVPDAKVVKAFNTTFAAALVSGRVAGQQLDILLASDHTDATVRVAEIIQAAGLRPIEAGGLHRARNLESLGLLHIALQSRLGTAFRSAVRFLP